MGCFYEMLRASSICKIQISSSQYVKAAIQEQQKVIDSILIKNKINILYKNENTLLNKAAFFIAKEKIAHPNLPVELKSLIAEKINQITLISPSFMSK